MIYFLAYIMLGFVIALACSRLLEDPMDRLTTFWFLVCGTLFWGPVIGFALLYSLIGHTIGRPIGYFLDWAGTPPDKWAAKKAAR
jgi:hypothetical protein